jgi:hypothetical protein
MLRKTPLKYALFFALVFSIPMLFSCTKKAPVVEARHQKHPPPRSITIWDDIAKFEPKDKKPPKEVEEILGKEVEIAGFIILNEGDGDDLKEFLITPISGGCIHVPPPPPNYIIHVTMPPKVTTKFVYGPILVNGILRLPKDPADRNHFTLEMEGHQVGPYQNGDSQ